MQSKDEKIAFLQKAIDITGKLQKLMVIFRKLVLTLDQVWSLLSALECCSLCGMTSREGATPMQAKWIKLDLY